MEYLKKGQKYFIRLEKEESLLATLEKFALETGVKSGHLTGIGALKNVELGFYHLADKKYERMDFPHEAELLSMDGNLSILDGKPFFHIHAVLGGHDFKCYGGHLFRANVAVTAEIIFNEFDAEISRTPNEEVGFSLLNLSEHKHD